MAMSLHSRRNSFRISFFLLVKKKLKKKLKIFTVRRNTTPTCNTTAPSLVFFVFFKKKKKALSMTFTSLFYNLAMTAIPVSFLNTIKSSIPLWTCVICRVVLKTEFSFLTYVSLVPLLGEVLFIIMLMLMFFLPW